MKNYELIEELMKCPAGYDVKVCIGVSKEEIGDLKDGERVISIEKTINNIGESQMEKTIELWG